MIELILRVGATTTQDIALNVAPNMVTKYGLNEPDIQQQVIQNLGDGNSLSIPAFANVTETIEMRISGATPSDVRDTVRSIEKLLDLARQTTTGYLDDKLYLIVRFDQDTENWRSQILAAKWDSNTLTDQIYLNYVTGNIVITRRYYFETETVHAIAIKSGPTPTATTGYASVYNADDTNATNRNWFELDATQVLGSLPTPATIHIKNVSGASRKCGRVFLGNYVYANPTTIDPIFRGEQSAGGFQPTPTESDFAAWSLANRNLTDAFKGQFGRVITVFSNQPAPSTLLRASLEYRDTGIQVNVALGEQILSNLGEFVLDLGGIPIPPGGYWQNMANLYLALKGRSASGTDSVAVDWVQVFPGGPGRYRMIRAAVLSMGFTSGDELVDDGANGGVYVLTGGLQVPAYQPFFEPIHLWPGKINRLMMLISAGTALTEVDIAWQVKVEARYRRITV